MNKKNKEEKYFFQRFEWKYIITKHMADKLYNELLSFEMEIDPFAMDASGNFYTVNSIYFDSPTLKCYHDKISGIKNRFKLRLRFYNDIKEDTSLFLEIKNKIDAIIIKERLKMNLDVLRSISFDNIYIDKKNILSDEQNIFKKFSFLERRYSMRPVVGVKYKRKPLVGKFDKKIRITFDYDLSSYDPRMTNTLINIDECVIMEVKYNNTMPSWVKMMIIKNNLNREAYSKYTHCLESIPIYKIKLNQYV